MSVWKMGVLGKMGGNEYKENGDFGKMGENEYKENGNFGKMGKNEYKWAFFAWKNEASQKLTVVQIAVGFMNILQTWT